MGIEIDFLAVGDKAKSGDATGSGEPDRWHGDNRAAFLLWQTWWDWQSHAEIGKRRGSHDPNDPEGQPEDVSKRIT